MIEANDGDLSMVALDGFRLAVAKVMIKEDTNFKAVIPGKNLTEIHKILEQSDKDVKLLYLKIKLCLNWNNVELYPNF